MTNCWRFWKMVLYQFGLSGLFAWGKPMNCFKAEFSSPKEVCGDASWQDSELAGEMMCVVWSVSPAWEAVELTLCPGADNPL